ncbi:MAG TPA: Hsp20/alpha crystallin family protein [Thermoanaerobaculia bacterium]|nr:Hsp20/alpha crystallin family protein [Thermoanaerobaculia bacterium]
MNRNDVNRNDVNRNEQTMPSAGIDETIGRIEDLYRTVTGLAVPSGDALYAPIPAERDPAEHVEEQLNRLLGMLGAWASPSGPAWAPPVSILESESEIVVEADLPGVGREQVTVTMQGNAVVVTGSRPLPRENGAQLRQNERPLGPFRRVIMLPGTRSGEPVAQMRDGVLEVRIQKDSQAAKPHTILVNHVN